MNTRNTPLLAVTVLSIGLTIMFASRRWSGLSPAAPPTDTDAAPTVTLDNNNSALSVERFTIPSDDDSDAPSSAVSELSDYGALEVVVTGGGDTPAVDVGVQLILPDTMASRAPTSDLTRRTDLHGRAAWKGLEPAPDYRWAILPPHHGTALPAHENRRLRVVDSGIQLSEPAPAGVSGRLSIVAGETVECFGRIVDGCRLTGCLPTRTKPHVKLFTVRELSAPGRTPVTSINFVSSIVADSDGAFAFDDLAPDLYIVRSCWPTNPHDLHFTTAAARLMSGEEYDLGDLRPTAGATATVTLRVQDTCGNRMRVEDVFRGADERPFGALHVELLASSFDVCDGFVDAIPVAFGETYTLHGLSPGRLLLGTHRPGWFEPKSLVTSFPYCERQDHVVGTGGHFDVFLTVECGVSRRLDLRLRDGSAPPAGAVWLREKNGGAVHRASPLRPSDGREITAPRGDYELWAFCSTDVSDYYGYCDAMFQPDTLAPLLVTMQPAARVTGRAILPNGAPAADRILQWTLPNWPCGDRSSWPFSTCTDAQGKFNMTALPPGLSLPGRGSIPDLITPIGGQAGERSITVSVDLFAARGR